MSRIIYSSPNWKWSCLHDSYSFVDLMIAVNQSVSGCKRQKGRAAAHRSRSAGTWWQSIFQSQLSSNSLARCCEVWGLTKGRGVVTPQSCLVHLLRTKKATAHNFYFSAAYCSHCHTHTQAVPCFCSQPGLCFRGNLYPWVCWLRVFLFPV